MILNSKKLFLCLCKTSSLKALTMRLTYWIICWKHNGVFFYYNIITFFNLNHLSGQFEGSVISEISLCPHRIIKLYYLESKKPVLMFMQIQPTQTTHNKTFLLDWMWINTLMSTLFIKSSSFYPESALSNWGF